MSVKFSGFDELQKELKKMADGAKELERTKEVPFSELFTTKFMKKHSSFSSFDEFLDAGNFNVKSSEDFDAIPDDVLDRHVSAYTNFTDWDDMLGTATDEYVSRKLGL